MEDSNGNGKEAALGIVDSTGLVRARGGGGEGGIFGAASCSFRPLTAHLTCDGESFTLLQSHFKRLSALYVCVPLRHILCTAVSLRLCLVKSSCRIIFATSC